MVYPHSEPKVDISSKHTGSRLKRQKRLHTSIPRTKRIGRIRYRIVITSGALGEVETALPSTLIPGEVKRCCHSVARLKSGPIVTAP